MQLSTERRKETGAFYTPKVWADLAIKYMQETIGNLEEFVFYDPACGEWALLEALPAECEKYGTTLEWEDVEICRDKGFQVWQMDFLEEKNIQEILPESKMKRLIVFTNPPYFKLKKDQYTQIKSEYNSNDSVALFYLRILEEIEPCFLCGFHKTDLYQSSTMARFRERTGIYERTLKMFLSPSKSWGLSGKFPIAFTIIF